MKLYRVSFLNQGKVYELYAGRVEPGTLPGFVEIGDLRFGETSTVVIDPSEEKLRTEFEGVENIHVPFHSVIRIDEVDRRGTSKIRDFEGDASVTPFPSPYTTSGKKRE
jgi:hypothetical protein